MSRQKRNWDSLVDYTGNYGINISEGLWPGSELDSKGERGQKGEPGQKGDRGSRGERGVRGEKGFGGDKGEKGEIGDSAYQIALNHGFAGSEDEWVASLKGKEGDKGSNGLSAYNVWVLEGNVGDIGVYLDSLKGDIGEDGEKGQKGDVASIFNFTGKEDDYQSIIDLPGPHVKGDVVQDGSTDDLWVWDGVEWVLLSEAVEVIKGQKGDNGQKGQKGQTGLTGDKGQEGDKGQKGDKGFKGDKGQEGLDGLSAYEIAVKGGFVGTDSEWVDSLHGTDGVDGESSYELYVNTVTDPNDLLAEGEWLDSLKGDKGEGGADIDTSLYYTKTQVNQQLQALTPPERSYIFEEMTEQITIKSGETANFRSNNQQDDIYSPGLVKVLAGAVVTNIPLNPPFLLVNYTITGATVPRGVDHTVLQQAYSADPTNTSMIFRVCRPGSSDFGDWDAGGGFDEQDYYTKNQTSMLVNGQVFYLQATGTTIELKDKIGEDAGTVPITGSGGIIISANGSGAINIDGTKLQNEDKLFLGILQDGETPTDKFPDADTGNFFVFAYEGTAPGEFDDGTGNVPTVKGGDLAYYDKVLDEWSYVESSAGGLLDVAVPENGLLETDKSNPKIPVISLDPAKVVVPSDLDPYATWQGLALQASQRLISSLKDVDISYTPKTYAGNVFNKVEFDAKIPLGDTPDGTAGMFTADPENNHLLLAKRDKDGNQVDAIFYNNLDAGASPKQKVRLRTSAGIDAGSDGMIGYISGKAARTNWYEITFDNPAVPLAALQAADLVIDIVEEDTSHGDMLSYDSNTSSWTATKGDFVSKSGDTMSGSLNFTAGVDVNFIGNNAGINLQSPYYGGLKYDGQLVFEWKADAVQAARDLNMKLGNVDFSSAEAESQYAGSDQHGGHAIHWLKAPSHKYDATNKEWVENKIQSDINFNNYTELT